MGLLRFHTLDVFTDQLYTGNPLAVVLGGDALSDSEMQAIAREFKLSETVFVLPATTPDAMLRLRIFTPVAELPFAGHPIVGAACLMAEKGLVPPGNAVQFSFEVAAGVIPVRLRREAGELVFAEIESPQSARLSACDVSSESLSSVFGMEPEAIDSAGPMHSDCGLPFLLIPLHAPEHLAGLDVDFQALPGLLSATGAHSAYVYAKGHEGELRCRMFSPGIGEDPATGSAALALAARLASEQPGDGEFEWRIQQGVEMGRPSELLIRAMREQGKVHNLCVGGYSVPVMEGHLNVA